MEDSRFNIRTIRLYSTYRMVDFLDFFVNNHCVRTYNSIDKGMKGIDRIEEGYVACRGCQGASLNTWRKRLKRRISVSNGCVAARRSEDVYYSVRRHQ
jgi:hypothetical protein